MTKHTYKNGNVTCVALLGKYEGDDVINKIEGYGSGCRFPMKFRLSGGGLRPDPKKGDPFELEQSWQSTYYTFKDVGGVEVLLDAQLWENLKAPEIIRMKALDISGRVDENALKGYLDDMLAATGVEEIDSERVAFQIFI